MPTQPEGHRYRSSRWAPDPGPARRWGSLQGGLGVCIVVASAAAGAILTMATRHPPGLLLGIFVVAGTVAAALAIRPGAGRMIWPAPALSYLAAALASGVIYHRSYGSSTTALAIAATQWIADGFFAMALATALAALITVARWYAGRRARTGRGPGQPVTAPGSPRRHRRKRDMPAEYEYPASRGGRMDGPAGGWGDAPSRGPGPRSPRPGPGPYNFSSGA